MELQFTKLLLITILLAVPVAAQCDKSLQRRVFNPSRLVLRLGCLTVRGKVISVRREHDGDKHILLLIDDDGTKFGATRGLDDGLINRVNLNRQQGALVLEAICARKTTMPAAVLACKGYVNKITIPKIGNHVIVSGVHVLDRQHGHMELHPVSQISLIP